MNAKKKREKKKKIRTFAYNQYVLLNAKCKQQTKAKLKQKHKQHFGVKSIDNKQAGEEWKK